ncbi:inverse autotransporter-like protein with beta domain [Roseimicrobium gellanilyticum]|uniref:Inverse autotransporter-like protein with beta domain n=1 Tax=Roseimicrobium gellanilyticum TaxID=748857 RepID=A0A366HXG4_9BACT|nr:inverse autotransporter beta domain-containing protein [Roseimicrobium gellanilyticum]RBP48244.1 inverse autotransporter-like protein with beta domain [Roseimicrobium gellanilyticum]
MFSQTARTRLGLLPTLALAGSLLFLPSHAEAGPVEKNPIGKGTVQVAEAHPMYLGTINSGIKTNDAYTDGNFSIVAPLWSSLGADSTLNGGLLFLEPYVSYGEGGEVAASLGLGYRHLFGTQSVSALTNHDGHQAGFFEEGAFIGANVFVDMLDTDSDNQFWQLGVGLEAGTRYVEFRGNYYIPLSDRQLAEERRSRETFRSTSSSTGGGTSTSVTPLGDPFATGNTVSQDGLFTTTSSRITRTTTTTTTIERLFQRFEEGMEGWDAEVAVLVPGLDRYMDVMLIGGYYSFDNQPFGPQLGGTGNVEGWKAGIEVRPVPALILSGTWYEDERLTGSDWTAGVQIQVPFEAGDLGDGKGFWDRIGDAFTPRRRHLMERLAEPVGRQNAAVKIANSFEESQKVVSRTSSTKVARSTRVVSQTAQRVVLADDIVFVNNGGDVGNGIVAGDTQANGADGTAELAYNNMVEGAAKAGTMSNGTGRVWKVYTQGGTGIDYSGAVETTGSTKFISSFTPLVALGNTNFGGGTNRPVLNGNISASGIGYMQVTGYDLRTPVAATPTIDVTNVGELLVTSNITSGGRGLRAVTNNGSTSTVNASQNQMTGLPGPTGDAMELISSGASTINVDIRDNQLAGGFSDGISLRDEDTAVIDGTVANNVLSGAYQFNGIDIDHNAANENTVEVVNNTLTGTFLTGLRLSASGATNATVLNASARGNIFNGTYTNGVGIVGGNAARNTSTVEGSQFNGTFTTAGVVLTTTTTGSTDVSILNNTFGGTFDIGVQFLANGTSTAKGTVQGNTFSGNFDLGINAFKQNGNGTTDVGVLGNTFSGSFTTTGIYFANSATGTGNIYGTVQDNVLSGTFGFGIGVDARSAGITDVDIINNQLSGSFSTGIVVRRNFLASVGQAKLSSDILGNQLSGNFSNIGILVDHRGTAPGGDTTLIGDVDLSNNVLTGNYLEGIRVSAIGGSHLDVTVGGNLIDAGNTSNTVAIYFLSGDASVLDVSGFNGNVITGPWFSGITVQRGSPGVGGALTVNGSLNAASNNEVSGELGNKVDIINPNVEPISGSFILNGSQVNLPMVVD